MLIVSFLLFMFFFLFHCNKDSMYSWAESSVVNGYASSRFWTFWPICLNFAPIVFHFNVCLLHWKKWVHISSISLQKRRKLPVLTILPLECLHNHQYPMTTASHLSQVGEVHTLMLCQVHIHHQLVLILLLLTIYLHLGSITLHSKVGSISNKEWTEWREGMAFLMTDQGRGYFQSLCILCNWDLYLVV